MSTPPETAVDPERLAASLPTPPADWERTDAGGGIVEYRLPGEDGVCATAKVSVRPELLEEAAVRIDLKDGCRSVGTVRYDDLPTAVEAVEAELAAAPE